MFQKISIRALFPILFVFLILAGGAHAQARQDYVGMPVNELPHGDLNLWSAAIPVVFDQQGWQQADKPLVQTCHGPSNADFSGEYASLIRVIDGRGRTLRQRQIASPRLVLPEDPRKQWSLAPQTAHAMLNVRRHL